MRIFNHQDAAWQTELSKRAAGTQAWRPEGREPAGQEQLFMARAAVATETAQAELDMLSGDWRFWMGIIAALSVGSALAGAYNEANYIV